MEKYCEEFVVRQYEVGRDHRLRLDTIANYMEEVAGKHADALGVGVAALSSQGVSWAMAKMRIILHKQPQAGTRLTMHTWPSSIERQGFRRDFSLQTASGEPIASAVTWWVVFDLINRKITQLPPCCSVPILNIPGSIDGEIQIPPVRNGAQGPTFTVRLADIDQNNHVNNVRYLDFLSEAAQDTLTPGMRLKQIDMTFRSEARMGDSFTAFSLIEAESPLSIIHSLKQGTTEYVRGRTVWE